MTHQVRGKPPAPRSDVELADRFLAFAALLLIAIVLIALLRGFAHWGQLGPVIWAHLATVVLALLMAPVQLLRRKGDLVHRVIGRIWAGLLFVTALISFDIRELNHGGFSMIHALSAFTVICVPALIWAARRGDIRTHKGFARGLTAGALLAAGLFTLLPSRVLGGWLFG